MVEIITTTTTTPSQIERDRYRFSGVRYSFRAPDRVGPSDMISELPGNFTFPRGEEQKGSDGY